MERSSGRCSDSRVGERRVREPEARGRLERPRVCRGRHRVGLRKLHLLRAELVGSDALRHLLHGQRQRGRWCRGLFLSLAAAGPGRVATRCCALARGLGGAVRTSGPCASRGPRSRLAARLRGSGLRRQLGRGGLGRPCLGLVPLLVASHGLVSLGLGLHLGLGLGVRAVGLLLEGRVPVVLDGVVRPAGQHLGDLGPLVAVDFVGLL
mmetsp:Transcript_10202/g.42347  ORF Transcript_10202/g.42347 Transcript_10202/m.42347 type:complete len:208 (+) Transcript_10202:1541-2164(+)